MKKILVISILFFVNLSHAAEVSHIGNKTLQNLIEQEVPVIDVRTTSEWQETGVIKGSYLMMFFDERGQYNLDQWLEKLSTIAKKKDPVILICLTGSRSNQLANYLTKIVGYENVYNVKRGIAYWMKQNYPTVVHK